MRFIIPVMIIGASVAQAQYDTLFQLARSFGLLTQLDCALPCVLQAANKLPCEGGGPADAICKNIKAIAEETQPCTSKCGAGLARG
jgi:hypothetical protein